jgi:hypothetical protein
MLHKSVWSLAVNSDGVRYMVLGSNRNLCCELCIECVLFFQVSDTSWICADGLYE